MKRKFMAALCALLSASLMYGCAERKEQVSVIYVDSGETSADSSSPAENDQTASVALPEIGDDSGNSLSDAPAPLVPNGGEGQGAPEAPAVVVPPVVQRPADTPAVPSDRHEPTETPAVPDNDDQPSGIVSPTTPVNPVRPVDPDDVPVEPGDTSEPDEPAVPEEPDDEAPEPPKSPEKPVGTNSYKALNYKEVKGIWISYIELAGLYSSSESSFRSSIAEVFDNCESIGINTVFVHVRSHSDAYYDSDYFPRTKYLGGSYDPLPIMIDEAHKRGLSFQAWINPLRGCSVGDISRQKGYALYDWAGGETRLVELNGYYYLNPAYNEVIDLIAKGAGEIAANYDVDGVHIDDYFYPTTETWFDRAAYLDSPYYSLDEFRLHNCDKLVSALYSAVKSANSTALFGVSPQGNLQNNYAYMYADVEKWCAESGYLDYIMPQIYFGFKNAAQPYSEVLAQWDKTAAKGNTPLIVGLSPAKLGTEDSWGGADGRYEWINDKSILKRQYEEAAETVSYGGICLYSYNSIFAPPSDVKEQVEEEINELKSAL